MKGDLMIIVDNSLYSINKDYHKERLECQIEAIESIARQKLESSPESTVGVMALGRSTTIRIVSPTNDLNSICIYLRNIKRDPEIECGNVINIAQMALKYRTNPDQRILLFLGGPIDDTALMNVVEAISDALNNNIGVGVVLFGEAIEYHTTLCSLIEECIDFTCIKILPNESFMDGVSNALKETVQEIDPEIELAIKRSLQDTEDPEVQRAINESLK
ncbi:26S proteasome regulatory subunit N10 [Nematocida sp. AWRm80]|nr:26S proteasome regulatory subunit N10 [Nematocida sp. AWRm80]